MMVRLIGLLKYKLVFRVMLCLALFLGITPPLGALPVESQGYTYVRETDFNKIVSFLEQGDCARKLKRLGISKELLEPALVKLDDYELHRLSGKVETIKSGGDGGIVWGILIVVLIVIAVLYFTDHVVKVDIESRKI
ncbi:MAG: PA2779 family protein [Candidatus Omnitrophota bacterium]